MRLASYHTASASHEGAWCTFHEIRMHSLRVTAEGSQLLETPDDLTEGTILRTHDGRYLEIFIVDRHGGRYFCETVDIGETAG
jgi:hypothetical protein